MSKRVPWNKGLKGRQPWHNTSGLGKNIDYKKRGESCSKAKKGVPLSEEHKQALSKSQTKKWEDSEYRKSQCKAMKGKEAWNKGKKMNYSKELREKLAKRAKSLSGRNHWNWKGGITAKQRVERIKFSRIMRKKVFKRDDYTCQICGQKGGRLQVDHIKDWAEYPELRFDEDNCRTLCQNCHYKETFGYEMPEGVPSWGHNLSNLSQIGG